MVAPGGVSLVEIGIGIAFGAIAVAGTIALRIGLSVIPAFAVGYVLLMSVLGTICIDRADRIIEAIDPAVSRLTGVWS
jgi:hypothetical protein